MDGNPTVEYTDSTLLVHGLELRILDTGAPASGDAPTFVLVHGLGVSSLYFRELADELAPHGRVLAVDLPGFGRTDKPERALRIPQLAAVVVEALGRLGLDDVVLVGHSMGCQVVVEALISRVAGVRAAVLIGPVVNAAERRLWRLLLRFAQSVLRETPASIAPSIVAWLRCGPRMLINTVPPMLGYRIEDRVAGLDAPLLLLAGEKDATAPRSWLEALAAAASGGAQAEIVVVPDASHQVMVTHPERVASQIARLAGAATG